MMSLQCSKTISGRNNTSETPFAQGGQNDYISTCFMRQTELDIKTFQRY